MDKKSMREIIDSELVHIPRKDLTQNILRSAYNGLRMHDLSLQNPEGRDAVLRKALDQLRKTYPDYKFQYDTIFFE